MSNFDLIQLLKSENEEERKTAAEALGRLKQTDATPFLIDALEVESRLGVAHTLVDALGNLADKRAVPVLFDLIERSDKWRTGMAASMSVHQLQSEIAAALGRIADKEILIEKLHHPDEKIRRTAAKALGIIRII